MLRRLRSLLLIALGAVAGALAGRLAAELRRRAEAGEELGGALEAVSLNPRTLSPRELVPGVVAAVRVRDVPWSYLHVPSWLAALSVNFGAAALARELEQLGELTRGGGWGGRSWEPGGWDGDEAAEPRVEVRDAHAAPGSPPFSEPTPPASSAPPAPASSTPPPASSTPPPASSTPPPPASSAPPPPASSTPLPPASSTPLPPASSTPPAVSAG